MIMGMFRSVSSIYHDFFFVYSMPTEKCPKESALLWIATASWVDFNRPKIKMNRVEKHDLNSQACIK